MVSVESPFLVSLLSLCRAAFFALAPRIADTSPVVVSGHDRVLGMIVDELTRILGGPTLIEELECVTCAALRELALLFATQACFCLQTEKVEPFQVVIATRFSPLIFLIALLGTIDDVDRSAESLGNVLLKVLIVWLPVACHDVVHTWLWL